MCRHMNVQGTIFMPVTTPQQKIQKPRCLVATISRYAWLVTISMIVCARPNPIAPKLAHIFFPFDDEDVIEGQASVAVEIERQLGGIPDHIVLPVGGGGLSSGDQLF